MRSPSGSEDAADEAWLPRGGRSATRKYSLSLVAPRTLVDNADFLGRVLHQEVVAPRPAAPGVFYAGVKNPSS